MTRTALRVGCALCALLLLALVGYPASLSTVATTDQTQYEHSVVPSSSEVYAERLAATEDGSGSAGDTSIRERQYAQLSPDARALFDQTVDESADGRGVHTFTPRLCKPGVYGCPFRKQDDLAPELAYDLDAGPSNASVIVVTDEERYVFATAAATDEPSDGGWVGATALIRLVILFPFVVFLLTLASNPAAATRRNAAIVGALAIVTLAFLASLSAGVLAIVASFFLVPVPMLLAPTEYDSWLGLLALGVGGAIAFLAVGPAYLDAYGVLPRTHVEVWLALALSWGGPLAIWALNAIATRSDGPGERTEVEGTD